VSPARVGLCSFAATVTIGVGVGLTMAAPPAPGAGTVVGGAIAAQLELVDLLEVCSRSADADLCSHLAGLP
jgi:hypothetical protein